MIHPEYTETAFTELSCTVC